MALLINNSDKISGDLSGGQFTGNVRPEIMIVKRINKIVDVLIEMKARIQILEDEVQKLKGG